MRIACSRCQTNYEVPDERLARGAIKVRCSQCGNMFLVRKRATPEPERPAPQPPPLSAEDFEATAEPPLPPSEAAAEEPEPPSEKPETAFEDFDFAAFQDREAAEKPEESPEPADTPAEEPETKFEDFDFASFQNRPVEEEQPPPEVPEPTETRSEGEEGTIPALDAGGVEDDIMSGLGELDLGEFEDLDEGLDLRGDAIEPDLPEDREPMERVTEEELVAPRRSRDASVQGIAESMPRLDIQRGPRLGEGVSPSPILARDRRRSPLFWVVLVAAFGTAIFTGYNIYEHPDKALTFLNPANLRVLWQKRQMEAKFGKEALKGYYLDLSGASRAFVVRGEVANRSPEPQSLIQVRVELFGPDGASLASKEAYCGNVVTDREITSLSEQTVEERLQNQVGQGLSNVDIAPGAKVPFTVVFARPPENVEKYNVTVAASKAGSGS